MRINEHGAVFLTSTELFDNIYSGKVKTFKNIYLDQTTINQFNNSKYLNRDNFEYLKEYIEPNISLNQFDINLQDNWFMPEDYKSFEIEKYLLLS